MSRLDNLLLKYPQRGSVTIFVALQHDDSYRSLLLFPSVTHRPEGRVRIGIIDLLGKSAGLGSTT